MHVQALKLLFGAVFSTPKLHRTAPPSDSIGGQRFGEQIGIIKRQRALVAQVVAIPRQIAPFVITYCTARSDSWTCDICMEISHLYVYAQYLCVSFFYSFIHRSI